MLVIDSREKKELYARALRFIPGADVAFLHAGDYLLFDQDGHSIGIERKEINDLIKTLANQERFLRQLDSLRQYDRGILLIEGHWNVLKDGTLCVHQKRRGWAPQSIQAILLATQERTDVKVLHTANYDETLMTLRMLHQRGEKGCFWPKDKTDEQAPRAA